MSLLGKEDELLAKLQKCVGKLDGSSSYSDNKWPASSPLSSYSQPPSCYEPPKRPKKQSQEFEVPRRAPITVTNKQNFASTAYFKSGEEHHSQMTNAHQLNDFPKYHHKHRQNYAEESYQQRKPERSYQQNVGMPFSENKFEAYGQSRQQRKKHEQRDWKYEEAPASNRKALGEISRDQNRYVDRNSKHIDFKAPGQSPYEIPRKRSRERPQENSGYSYGIKRTSISTLRPETSSKYLEAVYEIRSTQQNPDYKSKWRSQAQSAVKNKCVEAPRFERKDYSREPQTPNPRLASRHSSAMKEQHKFSRPQLNNFVLEPDYKNQQSSKLRSSIGSIGSISKRAQTNHHSFEFAKNFEQQLTSYQSVSSTPPLVQQRGANTTRASSPKKTVKSALEQWQQSDQDTFQKLKKISDLNESINNRIKNIISTFQNK